MSSITVKELNELIDKMYEAGRKAAEQKAILTELNKEVNALKFKVVGYLQELELPGFESSKGYVSWTEKTSFKIPKELEEKSAFYNYLKELNIFEEMATINYNTLNAFAKAEYEAAKEKGDMFFIIPGLGKPTITPVLKAPGISNTEE